VLALARRAHGTDGRVERLVRVVLAEDVDRLVHDPDLAGRDEVGHEAGQVGRRERPADRALVVGPDLEEDWRAGLAERLAVGQVDRCRNGGPDEGRVGRVRRLRGGQVGGDDEADAEDEGEAAEQGDRRAPRGPARGVRPGARPAGALGALGEAALAT
jgi:hypothetical protein